MFPHQSSPQGPIRIAHGPQFWYRRMVRCRRRRIAMGDPTPVQRRPPRHATLAEQIQGLGMKASGTQQCQTGRE